MTNLLLALLTGDYVSRCLQGCVIACQQRPQGGCSVGRWRLPDLDGQAQHRLRSWPDGICHQRHQVLHRSSSLSQHVPDVSDLANSPIHSDSLHCGLPIRNGEYSLF